MYFKISLLTVIALVGLLSCDDDPVSSRPPKDYVVYSYSPNQTKNCIAFHPSTAVIDSFALPVAPTSGLSVSADGKLLFLATEAAVSVFDLGSRAVTATLPYRVTNPVSASPAGDFIAITSANLITILNAIDYSLVYQDSIDLVHGAFSDDGFLYVGSTSHDTLLLVHLTDPVSVERRAVELSAWDVVRIVGDRLILYDGYFQVYDTVLDSIVFRLGVWPGEGDMAVSLDHRSVYLTAPGDLYNDPAAYTYKRVDLQSSYECSVFVRSTCGDSSLFQSGECEITPDGHWLIAKKPSVGFSLFGKDYLVQDLTGAVKPRTYCVPAYKMFLACQAGK